MKLRRLFASILCVWLSSICVAALNDAQKVELRASLIDDIPPCGITCLFLTVPPSGCALDDYDCQCQNNELAHTLSACMLANCTMADSLNTAKVQKELCHLSNESRQHNIYVYTITCYTIAAVFVVLRVIGRIVSRRVAFDDCIVVVALLLTAVPLGLVIKMAGVGFGDHLWDLQPGQLLENLRFFYVAWITYTFVLGLTKVSLTLIYYEIFRSQRARIGSLILLGWIVINTFILVFLTIFNCIPVQAFWDRDIKNGKCLNINAIAYANSVSAIIQDVALLVFPVVCIWKLNMKTYRKFAVGLMFAIGTLGCVATIVRLHSLLTFKTSIDPTWDYVPITLWTEIELACCFVCVSLPAIRILVVRIVPEKFFTSLTSRLRSRMTTVPDLGVNNAVNNPVQKKRGFRNWIHISMDHDTNNSGQTSEMSVLGTAARDEQNEKGFTQQPRRETTSADSDGKPFSMPQSST